MSRRPWLSFGFIVPMLAALLLVIAVSCGGSATSTPASQAAATTALATMPAPSEGEPTPTRPLPQEELRPTATPVPAAGTQATTAAAMETTFEPEGTLNIGFKEFGPYQTHPAHTGFPQYGYIGLGAIESLFSRDVNGEVFGKLVDSWTIGDDELTWTFNLKEGVQFQDDMDGNSWGELTADDVVWSISAAGEEGSISASLAQIRRVFLHPQGHFEALDPYTVELNTGVPAWDVITWLLFPGVNAAWVVSKKQADELAASVGAAETTGQLVSTGPYRMLEHRTGEFWKFAGMNPHYRRVPEWEFMNFFELPEESTRIANFETGKIDVFSAAPDTVPVLAAIPDVEFMSQRAASESHVGFYGMWNHTSGEGPCPTDAHACPAPAWDPDAPYISAKADVDTPEWEVARKVRLAMGLAIDRELIVEELLNGEGSPLSMWGWAAFPDLAKDWVWEYDVPRALELMKEAGYEDGFNLTITPSIRGAPAEVEACEAIADMWADINITANLTRVPFSTLSEGQMTRGNDGLTCHAAGPEVEPLVLWSFQYDPRSAWSAGSDHPVVSELYYKGQDTFDRAARETITVEIGQWVWDNSFDIGTYIVNSVYALGPKVGSWAEHMERNDPRRISGLEWAPHRR